MKKYIMALLLGVIISVGGTACGSNKEDTTETVSEDSFVEESEAELETPVEAAEEAPVEEAPVEETSAEEAPAEEAPIESTEESSYSVFTSASDEEVEEYAQKIVDAVLAKDWDTIGDMIEYPIGTTETNNLCNNKEEFLSYVNNTGFSDEELEALASWKISDLWANWQGACIADGTIWFRDIGVDNSEFKIVSLFDLREAGGEITD